MNLRHDMMTCYVVRANEAGALEQVLQLRRAPGEFMAGAWGPVRGRIEANETAHAAALRELAEETGLIPTEFYQLDSIDLFYLAVDDSLWHCPGFCAVIGRAATITLNEENDAARWIDRADIDRNFLWPGERMQLAELCREIFDNGPAKRYLRLGV